MKRSIYSFTAGALAVFGVAFAIPVLANANLFNGEANQILGINARGTEGEAKAIVGAGTVAEGHSARKITLTGTARRFDGVAVKSGSFTVSYRTFHTVTGTSTATLPTAVGHAGEEALIKNIDGSTTVTMASTSSQTINGGSAGSVTISAGNLKGFVSDGANWISY